MDLKFNWQTKEEMDNLNGPIPILNWLEFLTLETQGDFESRTDLLSTLAMYQHR